jgi:hypothetical protein
MNDYAKVPSLTLDAFKERMANCLALLTEDTPREDIARIERLLDLGPGALSGQQNVRVAVENCSQCNRKFSFYDVVFTAIVDAGHPKSFIAHTLLGAKHIVNTPRNVRCSACLTVSENYAFYNWGWTYGC